MSATEAGGVVIVCGGTVYRQRRDLPCWGLCYEFEQKCGRDRIVRPCVMSYDASPWYAPEIVCTVCGDRWSDGEMGQRPWERGWRSKAIARALEMYATASDDPPARDDDGYILRNGGAS